MKITIKSIYGKNITFEVEPNIKISDLIDKSSEEFNIRREKIKLVYAGICIDRTPEKTIAELNIRDNAIIHLAGNKYVHEDNTNCTNSTYGKNDNTLSSLLANYLNIRQYPLDNEIITLRKALEDARLKIEFLSSSYE